MEERERSDRRGRSTSDAGHGRAHALEAAGDGLIGRTGECRRIDAMIARLRERTSETLIVTGLPGIGKTALLRYAMAQASGLGVAQALGLETETSLPFSTLATLLRPFAHRLKDLPQPRRAALSAALGLGSVDAADRLTVGSATLSCLALAADERPMLVVLDDGQWVDPSSAEALLFACRRLAHEGVGVLIAVRDGASGPFVDSGLATLHLDGLGRDDARRLIGHDTAPDVAERIVASTGGHPLAILELARVMSDPQRSGAEPLPDPLPAGDRVQCAFASRVEQLSDEAGALLVMAAANVGGEVGVLTAACNRVGIGEAAFDEVCRARIVDLTDNRLLFVHPLMRSVVYQHAGVDPRREAHRVLAESLRRESDLDRRAWHLAAAAAGPDERAASALEDAAAGARGRGAFAEAAAAFQRAAELSPCDDERAHRLMGAGNAFWRGGQSERAATAFDDALAMTADPVARADIRLRTGVPVASFGPLPSLREELIHAANEVRDLDPGRAGLLMAQASLAALTTGDVMEASSAAEDAVALTAGKGLTALAAALALALARLARGDMEDANGGLDVFVALIDSTGIREELFGVGESIASALMWVDRFADARRLLDGMVAHARGLSAPGMLPLALAVRAELAFWTGGWTSAFSDAWGAASLARESQQYALLPYALVAMARVESAAGRDQEARDHLASAVELAEGVGHRSIEYWARAALGFVDLGAGRISEAAERLEYVATSTEEIGVWHPSALTWLGDLVEVQMASGRHHDAQQVSARLDTLADRTGGVWVRAAAARARGIVAIDDGFEQHFLEALESSALAELPFERARTHLCFGEQLRRADRATDAAGHLWAARVDFVRLGASPWIDRTDRELAAYGETPGRVDRHGIDRLTPQEIQVATAVAAGATNREAAEQLFLSRRTVEHHLGNVYRKLGIHSRMHLVRLMSSSQR